MSHDGVSGKLWRVQAVITKLFPLNQKNMSSARYEILKHLRDDPYVKHADIYKINSNGINGALSLTQGTYNDILYMLTIYGKDISEIDGIIKPVTLSKSDKIALVYRAINNHKISGNYSRIIDANTLQILKVIKRLSSKIKSFTAVSNQQKIDEIQKLREKNKEFFTAAQQLRKKNLSKFQSLLHIVNPSDANLIELAVSQDTRGLIKTKLEKMFKNKNSSEPLLVKMALKIFNEIDHARINESSVSQHVMQYVTRFNTAI